MAKRMTVRWLFAVATGVTLAASIAGVEGCGGDDTNVGPGDGGNDATTDHVTPPPDTGTDTSQPDAGPDSGCGDAQTSCNGACVDLTTDIAHCGSCTHACGSGGTCAAGKCSTDITAVAAGVYFDCALRLDGTVWCWGSNQNAELGVAPSDADKTCGSQHCNKAPQKIPGLTNIVAIATGTEFACAVKNDNTVWCWGRNTLGQLGHAPGTAGDIVCDDDLPTNLDPGETPGALPDGGTGSQCNPTPSQVPFAAGTKLASVSAGWAGACSRSIVSTSDAGVSQGDVYCWGMNSFDQLGQADAGPSIPTPSKVPAFNGDALDIQMALTTRNACVLRLDGTIWCWGDNRLGRSGVPEGSGDDCATRCSATPVQVRVQAPADAGSDAGDIATGAALTSVVAVRPGGAGACALKSDGTVWCWGYDGLAQLGDNGPYTADEHVGARQVPGLPTTIKKLTRSTSTAIATESGGTVWTWGDNTLGESGNGSLSGKPCPEVTYDGGACIAPPATVSGLANATAITTGAFSGLALKNDGTVIAWGRNSHGQLGHAPGASGDLACVGPPLIGITPDNVACSPTPSTIAFP